MKAVLAIAVMAVLAVHVTAECNNMCSGHGVCGTHDMCTCYRNWRGADCSERSCQFARSFVDTAQGDLNHDGKVQASSNDVDFNLLTAQSGSTKDADGNSPANAEAVGTETDATTNFHTRGFVTVRTQWRQSTFELFPHSTQYRALNHVYMECSNKGSCDRETGECNCYPGYEGSACQRSVCPNSCSGHGICRNLADISQGYSTSGNYTYKLWDALKIQQCVCDPGYDGVDCSKRLCPKGDDPLSPKSNDQINSIVTVELHGAGSDPTGSCAGKTFGGSFRFQFTDAFGEEWVSSRVSGVTKYYDGTCATEDAASIALVEAALTGIPNSVIPSVSVTTADDGTTTKEGRKFAIEFTGNPGNQLSNLKVTEDTLTDTDGSSSDVTVTITGNSGTFKTNTECSDRGLCDYETGICDCFRGYRLADCSGMSALAY